MDNSNIFSWLYKQELSEEEKNAIIRYIDNYLVAYEEYLIDPSDENAIRLQYLSGPVDEVYNLANPHLSSGKTYPAVSMIMEHIDEYGRKIEKNFEEANKANSNVKTLALTNQKKGYSLTEDFNYEANAFWQAPLILGLCLIIGLILGALLFYIK